LARTSSIAATIATQITAIAQFSSLKTGQRCLEGLRAPKGAAGVGKAHKPTEWDYRKGKPTNRNPTPSGDHDAERPGKLSIDRNHALRRL